MENQKKESSGKTRYIIINFVRLMLVLAFIGAYINHRPLILFISLVAFLITFLPSVLEKKYSIKIPAEFEIMIILFIYGTLFFGEVRGFYARFWWWDVLLNLGASIALGLLGLAILYSLYKDKKLNASPLMIAIFTFTFAFALGSLWEIFEFAVDRLFDFNFQNADLVDTMKDIISNAAGSLIVAIAGYNYVKYGKINVISTLVTAFIEKNPLFFKSKDSEEIKQQDLLDLIKKKESGTLEFKSTLRTNIHTNNQDKKVEHGSLKSIASFLNTAGGTLLIGVSDSGNVEGIEKDNFETTDKFMVHLTNLIKEHIGRQFFRFLSFELIKIEDKTVLKIEIKQSDKEVFLKFGDQEEFFIRTGPSSVQLQGSALVDYVSKKFVK